MNDFKVSLTFEQKLIAIMSLDPGDVSLHLRYPVSSHETRWYLTTPNLSLAAPHTIEGIGGRGESCVAAVEAAWDRLTELKSGMAIERSWGGERTYHRWNGFMWAEVERPA